MSSKFASSTMLNKTPPVCQKHQPGPDLPPTTIWPFIHLTGTVFQPLFFPTEIWQVSMQLELVGPGLLYQGEKIDSTGRNWTANATWSNNYQTWTGTLQVIFGIQFSSGLIFQPVQTMTVFPLDTGLAIAQSVFEAQNVRWRFTV